MQLLNVRALLSARPARWEAFSVCRLLAAGFAIALLSGAGGCASTGETARTDPVTAQVGNYSPPPQNIQKARVGVPQFQVQSLGGWGTGGSDLDRLAADQMSSVLHQSRRFDVIERAQLEQLLKEQDLEGIVDPSEAAQTARVRGVDYLLLGKVTNFRIKAERTDRGVGIGGGGGLLGKIGNTVGGAQVNKSDLRIHSEAGVDLRLVDPTTGQVAVAHFGEFKRTDSASGMGLGLGGINVQGNADIQVSNDDAGKILRLALDEALRKMLPEIDEVLLARGATQPGAALGGSLTVNPTGPAPADAPPSQIAQPPAQPQAGAGTAEQPTAAKKFCGECGTQIAATAKFCPSCGNKVE